MEQTFQRGDIVLCGAYNWSGIFQEIDEDGSAHFRNRTAECVCEISELAHDRDFQVGDWVRYEGVSETKTPQLNGRTGKIEKLIEEIDGDWLAEVPDFYPLASGRVFVENLIKIAPPTEEKMSEKVIIEHDQWERVEGVARKERGSFTKNGGWWFESEGWREVPKTKWVPVHVNIDNHVVLGSGAVVARIFIPISGIDDTKPLTLPPGFRWKSVEIEREEEGGVTFNHITFSVNSYDQDGDVVEEGIFLHFGQTSVLVCRKLSDFDAFIETIKGIRAEISEHHRVKP